ncbi:MAG: hypothetical protein KAI83_10800 [Thiomargarita sp.]|nr:hypothetical protein [Thiomargarita sp.]
MSSGAWERGRTNLLDAGASKIGSHAGAWEPETRKMPLSLGVQTFRFGIF